MTHLQKKEVHMSIGTQFGMLQRVYDQKSQDAFLRA